MLLSTNIQEQELKTNYIWAILFVFPVAFFLFGIFIATYEDVTVINGLKKIVFSSSVLSTDFLEVGGIGAAFINASLVGFFNLFLLKYYKIKINGILIAAFMMVLGFSFLGKNIFNIIPIYLGGYIYCYYQKISMKDIIVVIMFATSMSPIVSELSISALFLKPYGLIIGILAGMLIGFIIVPLNSHMVRFHDGFNLYNMGFTAGIVGTVFASVLRSFNKELIPASVLYLNKDLRINILLAFLFSYLMIMGIVINPQALKKYKIIFKYTGRSVTDFTQHLGYGVSFFNMGVMGLLCLGYIVIVGGSINGPVLASIFSVVGFSAFGKHPKNCFAIVVGVVLGALLMKYDLSAPGIISAALFSTTVAPISATYGMKIGIIAGMLHLALVTNIDLVHGGINLYNNGFSGGLVAGFLVPIIDAFKKGEV